MSTITDKIKSLRESTGATYQKPNPEKVDKMHKELWNNVDALDYLRHKRGLSDDTIKHFKLGYDEGKNAISIPVYKQKEVINIKYRILNPEANKYTSEYGCETWIFNEDGIQEGHKKKKLLIVEGEFDAMSAWQVGIRAVVSPASGKDSYGVWIEHIDTIPSVTIAYDNDTGGKQSSAELAERLGIEKCKELEYPEGIKDANEFFNKHSLEDFKKLVLDAKPFYQYQFKGLGDVIESLRGGDEGTIKTDFIPSVDIGKDWLVVVSGESNIGKTSYVMNVANDFTKNKIPTLVLPFERGIESVGKRFLQVKFNKTLQDFQMMDNEEWGPVLNQCLDVPLYFSVPDRDDIVDTIIKAKRIFNTKIVIVDHLDYIIRHVSGNRESEISNTLQNLKRVAEENGIIIIIVTHIRKIQQAGAEVKRKPNIEDLKGSSSLYQDPECVVMLSSSTEGELTVDIVKNKGKMDSKDFVFSESTGKLDEDEFDKLAKEF